MAGLTFNKGDVIGGQYEVHGTLGEGGFGVVYLVQVRDTRDTLALKTVREELLADPAARATFKKEALLWVNLERHPFVLTAEWVDEASGRLFITMEYVAPDAQGRVTLADHLAWAEGPLDTNQTLNWAIQFCLGMEHARAHGIECHCDIKPGNILIAPDGTLRVSDFGLAVAAEAAWRGSGGRGGSLVTSGAEGGFGFSLMLAGDKVRCGTPGYIAPEVYRCEGASVRSDIYSFGLVLWQMAAGSSVPPFLVPRHSDVENYLRGIYEQQMAGRVPLLEDPLGNIIERCLRPRPSERYGSFQELRAALEPFWTKRTGKKFEVPDIGQWTTNSWSNTGAALTALDRHEEAVSCYNKALVIDSRNANAWVNKGISLQALGRSEEALSCYDKALALDPQHAKAWGSMGATLADIGQHQQAIECFDKALAIDPRNAGFWHNRGVAHRALGEMHLGGGWFPEAIRCFDKALEIDSRNANAWDEKGLVHRILGRESGDTGSYVAALVCFDKALAVNPLYLRAWSNKADTLNIVRLYEDAIGCCEKALGIDPENAVSWYNKALAEDALKRWREARSSYQRFVELAPPLHAQAIAYARQRIHELGLSR
jgi:tetratricopeptide (TPR) repeat protein